MFSFARSHVRLLLCAALSATCVVPAAAQSGGKSVAAKKTGGDPEVIDFIYPGNFAEVLKRAKARHRPIVIKGVAFGVDKTGATCATKGHW
jgi:hypothetical protein